MESIQRGDVILIQKQSYMKTHKLPILDTKQPLVQLGRDSIDLGPVLGQPYGSCFKMTLGESQNKKVYTLELSEKVENFEEMLLEEEESGTDNRNLFDAAAFSHIAEDATCSQKLSKEDIEAMREKGIEGSKIIEELIENSASFGQKTRFSQEKFVKKKSKKYFPYVMIRKPTLRLLAQIYYANDPMKILNLRVDSLAQMLNAANVQAGAKYMVYETGCQGLLVSSVLERIVVPGDQDPEPKGKLIHIFQTGCPQTQAVSALNFQESDIKKYVSSLNIFHLRSLENGLDLMRRFNQDKEKEEEAKAEKKELQEPEDVEAVELLPPTELPQRQRLREESIASYAIMKERSMDGLLIACKQHPTNLVLALIKYLAPSRPFVVFSPYKEPLMETYTAVKDSGKAILVTLSESWLRNYQVLPERSHPEVMMSGGGGYILSGIIVDNTEVVGQFENGAQHSGRKNHGRKRCRD